MSCIVTPKPPAPHAPCMRALALSYDRALGIHFQRQVHFQNRVISGRKPGLTRGKPATQNLSVPAAHAVPDLPYLHLLVRGRYGLLTGLMAGSSEVETHPCLNQQRSAQSLGEAVSQLLVCPHMQNTQLLCLHTLVVIYMHTMHTWLTVHMLWQMHGRTLPAVHMLIVCMGMF